MRNDAAPKTIRLGSPRHAYVDFAYVAERPCARDAKVSLVSLAIVFLIFLASSFALAQGDAQSVLYAFTGTSGGAIPDGSVFDSAGNLYGTSFQGGSTSTTCNAFGVNGCGVVFKLTPSASGPWTETVLYTFTGGSDGGIPGTGVILDSVGNLYGTTLVGGNTTAANCVGNIGGDGIPPGCGVVFKLTSTASGPWTETVLYTFTGGDDGALPFSRIVFDKVGNLYGEALFGGVMTGICASVTNISGCGLVFKLAPAASGPWTESVLYAFTGSTDGALPQHGLHFDSTGNLYGVTDYGGDLSATCDSKQSNTGCGVAFELTAASGTPWKETVLYTFSGGADGGLPTSGISSDPSGNFYGVANAGGDITGSNCNPSGTVPGCGVVYKLTPAASSPWTETVLYTFTGGADGAYTAHDSNVRYSGIILDNSTGYLYGSTPFGGNLSTTCDSQPGCGVVFKLMPSTSGPWTETLLHTFTGGNDGGMPQKALLSDSSGNIYGSTFAGGDTSDCTGNTCGVGCGVVFRLTPITASTTVVTSSLNPSASGQLVTLTAVVSGASPTGTVRFSSNGTTIGTCTSVTITSNQAQCATSSLASGTDVIVATYSGDTFNTGSSGVLTQVVNNSGTTPTTTTVTSSLSPSMSGQSVTLTATVSPDELPTPTGTVGFTSNGITIPSCTGIILSSSLTAACTSGGLAVGTDTIVATYSGDSHYGGGFGTFSQLVNPLASAVQFVPIIPCRVVDTRNTPGPFGGPEVAAGTSRSFTVPSGACVIPDSAVAYSLNVTVVPPGPLGYVSIWPTGEGQPLVSTLNSLDGRIKANAAIVPAGTGGAVTVYANNSTNVVLDVNGYFVPSSTSTLQFYPLTPCRVADTRNSDGPLGGPSLVAATQRSFPILESSCGIPDTAKAYSLNFTVIPPTGGTLAYLTVWPEGETKPLVSTLNDLTGTIVANAAIVPAGTGGGVTVYPSDATNLVIDVNGYFAPAGTGGLSLYTVTPCRVLDTRKTTGAFTGKLAVSVASSSCAPPSTSDAYVFNATVIPTGDLGYLTLWPDGENQPVVSTLNAADGAITSNMAIVPNNDGKTDAYASGTTQLILDISAYFAP